MTYSQFDQCKALDRMPQISRRLPAELDSHPVTSLAKAFAEELKLLAVDRDLLLEHLLKKLEHPR